MVRGQLEKVTPGETPATNVSGPTRYGKFVAYKQPNQADRVATE
jgi:hypothetical protein